MQELNARVDIDKEKPADVARDYLVESGYVRGSSSALPPRVSRGAPTPAPARVSSVKRCEWR